MYSQGKYMEFTGQILIDFLPDIVGIIGVCLVLWYYFLLQIGKCASDSLGFSLGNLMGSILLLISLWFNWNISSVLIEIAWFFISVYGIVKYFYRLLPEQTTKT